MNNRHSDMTVTILGSGTCVPSLARSASSALIKTGNARILVDCGPGTMHRLLEAGCSIHDVTHLFLTHFHPDHSSELVPFLFATKYPDRHSRARALTLAAGKGFLKFFEGLKTVYGTWIDIGQQLKPVIEMGAAGVETRRMDCFHLTSVPVAHNEESIAYRVDDLKGHSLVYSGDTDYTENLVALARHADLFICESALPDSLHAKGHLTPSLAGKMAAKAGVRKLILTHFYPECDRADIAAECRRTYDGPLVLAEDLMEIKI
jgi:ribonuclease BN (tRNA processing enzyme)